MTTRRAFIRLFGSTSAVVAGSAVWAQGTAPGAAQMPILSEQDPQAQALGYVADAARVDKVRYPKYAAGQHCSACQLYQAVPATSSAPCALFAGKKVAGPGWCSAYSPRQG